MASLNYSVDSHPVRFPVVDAVLGAGGHVVYEDPQHGTSWGLVEELKLVVGIDMATTGADKTVVVPVLAPVAPLVPEATPAVAEAPVAPVVAEAPAVPVVAEAPVPVVAPAKPSGKKPTAAL